jgi:hypothetical protein
MTRQELIHKLVAHKEELRRMGVISLAIFGSVARDEISSESDIDLLVEFDHSIGVFHFFTVQHRLEEILGVPKVDLVQRGAVHPAFRDRILSEAIHVT